MAAAAMDCTNWDRHAYRESILQKRETLSRTVFRTAFPLESDPYSYSRHPDLIVAACSDGSISSYSIASHPGSRLGDASAAQDMLAAAEPNCLIQGHDGPAYDVKFYGYGKDSLLLSCGDDGRIRGWKRKQLSNFEEGGDAKPVFDLVNPQHKGPWGSLSPIPENNAIAVDNQNGSVFAAAGDSLAYCWDLETCKIKMVFEGHSDYLHSVVTRTSCNQIITGSEDGQVRIWDCNSGKCTQIIDPRKRKNFKVPFSHISCIALDGSESWLVCGSGRSLSLWNLPAGECVSRIRTNASIQDVVFEKNEILAVGAEASLNRFNMTGDMISQIQCAPHSSFSVSLHSSGVVAVAGYGALVDIISSYGSHLCTFRCKGL